MPRSSLPHVTAAPVASPRPAALEMTGLQVSYVMPKRWTRRAPASSGAVALDLPNLSLGGGDVTAIAGGSGAGKSSLLRVVMGLVASPTGAIRLDGEALHGTGVDRRALLGYVPDQPELPDYLRVREYLAFHGALYGMSRAAVDARSDSLLSALGLHDLRGELTSVLSLGMRHKLAIAAALLHSPRVLLLDEPTTAVDGPSATAVGSLLQQAASQGAIVLFSSHDISFIRAVADRAIRLEAGRLVADASPAEVFAGDGVTAAPGTHA